MSMKNAVEIFKALSDQTRLRIVVLLMQRELCVCELMFILKMEQSRLSHQLRILREAGLVEDIRKGRWMIYRISGSARKRLRAVLGETVRAEAGKSASALDDIGRLNLCVREKIRFRRAVNSGTSKEEKGTRPGSTPGPAAGAHPRGMKRRKKKEQRHGQ
jgi:ArsR family transcriptional regulator